MSDIEALRHEAQRRLADEERVTDALNLIEAERRRQKLVEGWTTDHDDEHFGQELATAAACYALPPTMRRFPVQGAPALWPWHPNWWKPSPDRLRELVKAGALIVAEIERIQRAGDTEDNGEGEQ